MQFFYWIVLLIAIGIAVFAIQNSNAPLVTIKFIFWKLETSLVYTILGFDRVRNHHHPSLLDPKGHPVLL